MNQTIISILSGLGGMFGWGTSDFFANLSADKIGNFKTFFWSQLAGMIFTLLLIPIFGIIVNLPPLFVFLLLIASIFYAGAYLLFYKAFEIGNVSIVSATINLYAVFTMIFAFIFLGQRLSALQLLAVLMIIAGVTLVSLKLSDLKNKEIQLLSGVKETVLAALLFGVFWNLSEIISEKTGWLSTTLFVKIGAILFLLIFSLVVKQKLDLVKTNTKTKFIVTLVGIILTTL